MTEPPALHRRVLRSAAWSTLSTLVGVPIGVVSTLIVARALGAEEFGRLALYTFVTGLVFGLVELGLGQSLHQRGAQALGRGDHDEVVRCARAALTLALLRLPLVIVAGFLVLPGLVAPVLYAIAMVFALAFIGPSYYLVSISDLAYASQLKLGSTVLVAVGGAVAAVLSERADVTFGVTALAANVATVLLVFGVAAQHRRAVMTPGRLILTRGDVSFGLANFANGQLIGFVFSRSELLFFPAGAATARGTFAAAQTIAARSTLALDSLFAALPMALSTAAGTGAEALERAFRRVSATVLVLLAGLAPTLTVVVVSVVSPAFGRDYVGVAPLALVMTSVSIAQSGIEPLNLLRYARRQVRPMLAAGLSATVVDLAAAAWLVPRHGAAGAAAANAGSGLLFVVVTAALYASDPEWRHRAGHHTARLAATITASALSGLAALVLADGAVPRLVIGVPLALAASAALLLVPRVRPPRDDVASVLGSLREQLPAWSLRLLRH